MKSFNFKIAVYFAILLGFNFNYSQNNKPQPDELSQQFNNLKWRNIGPFRGGRSVACTGVVNDANTYYMGSTGGGVWKTEDSGITWKNISDGYFKTGTVGAISVSESNPNIIYVGMGEHPARGVMTSMGDGVYKSTDAGKTWTHIGLDKSRHISDVIINPTNPDIVFVSVQGAQYGPTLERGVYKSTDGGKTWKKTLYINDTTGASGLTMDYNNPLILYAAMWEHRRYPWVMESGTKTSGLYKSNDGGETWNKMEKGLPNPMGKAGISVSRANSDMVYAVIEAEGKKAGVYKSVNAGNTWKQVNSKRVNITRSWYYMEIFADPQNENIVYVMNAPAMRSIDGGKTFKRMPTPHGDNHDLWINPNNNKIMINSNDGGANVSHNFGKSWSVQSNQPTSQFYRVITDNLVPYNVYGGQQDNSAIAIASRTNSRSISWKDWHSVAGCESAFLAFDPDNPENVYGGCYQGIIEKWVASANEGKPIKTYPELGLSIEPKDFKYRYNWNSPIISSPHDRNTIYHAGNVVFKTTDEGQSWEVVSPDLTKNEKDKQGPGAKPFTNEAAGGENYNTIASLVESSQEKGVMYAGTDDGLVHITKDGGKNWTNITPKQITDGIINSIEVSPHNPATAYITVMRYKSMDLTPYIFKTENYGKTWKKITNGLNNPHSFVRVVRADKKVKGLLYAGTETGLYVSHNDGQNWKPLQLNLPVVPINDLYIQDNDLVAATAGRSFWILDDLGAIQNMNSKANALTIFKPKDTYRILGGHTKTASNGLGQNPKSGVTFDYYLPKDVDSLELKLEIYKGNTLLKTYTNKKPKGFKTWEGGPPRPEMLPAKKGFNRFTWDFTKETLPSIEKVFLYGNYRGSKIVPGNYTLKLSLGNDTSETEVTVLQNPKIKATPAQFEAQEQTLTTIENTIRDIHQSVNKMRSVKQQLQSHDKLLADRADAKDLVTKGKDLVKRISTWEENLIQPKQKTFQDVINFNNKLSAQLMHLKGFVDVPEPNVTEGAKQRLQDLLNQWNTFKTERDQIINTEMADYNATYNSLKIPALIIED